MSAQSLNHPTNPLFESMADVSRAITEQRRNDFAAAVAAAPADVPGPLWTVLDQDEIDQMEADELAGIDLVVDNPSLGWVVLEDSGAQGDDTL